VSRSALVVDDEPDMVASYERLLRRQGLTVVSTGTLEGGLRLLPETQPALLVCDLRLPDGDGLDVVRAARAMLPPPAVIVVTGYASVASRDAAVAAGAAAFMTKPFSVVAFGERVREALSRPDLAQAD
jgi:DNA-binding NtrC family response regulator